METLLIWFSLDYLMDLIYLLDIGKDGLMDFVGPK